jgi:hypothetical protein
MTPTQANGQTLQQEPPGPAGAPGERQRAALGTGDWLVVLLAFGTIVYLPALRGVFTLDDYPWILHNARLEALDPWLRRPVTLLTFAANLRFGGRHPLGFHLVDIALHLTNAVLVFRLLERTLPRNARALAAAAVGAGLFLLHPAQTEAVTYVSGRATALMTFFLLLAHLTALRGLDAKGRRWTAVSLACFALAVGAKEIALVYPVLWWTWLVFERGLPSRQALRRAVPHATTAVVLVAGMALHPGYRALLREAAGSGTLAATPAGRIEQQLGLGFCFNDGQARTESCTARRVEGLAGLTRVLITPWSTSIDPGRRPVRTTDVLLVVCLVLAVAGALRTRPGGIASGAAWALASLLPTHLLLVRSEPVADRLLYLPMVGVALVVATAAQRAPGGRRLAASGIVAALLLLGALTWQRNSQYQSELVLWRDAVAKNGDSPRALVNLGFAYELEGELGAAAEQYRLALVRQPGSISARRGLDRVLSRPSGGTRQ